MENYIKRFDFNNGYAKIIEMNSLYNHYFKGVLMMCREMENMRKAERIEIAKRMLASGKLTYEDIAAFTDLILEEIEALAVQKTA